MCNKGCTALEGACPFCKIPGTRVHSATKFVGAITHTPDDSQIRADFAREFRNVPHIAAIARQPKAPRRTIQEAIDSGRRYQRAKEQLEQKQITGVEFKNVAQREAFTDVDAFTLRFGTRQFNKLEDTIVDSAHELMNSAKDLLHLVGCTADTSMAFTKVRKEYEQSIGRFTEVYMF